MAKQWIAVVDEMPEEGAFVLVTDGEDISVGAHGFIDDGWEEPHWAVAHNTNCWSLFDGFEPTHWKKPPRLPKVVSAG